MIGAKSFKQSKDCKEKVLVQICMKVALEMIKCEKYKPLQTICSQDSSSWITIIFICKRIAKKHLLDTPKRKSHNYLQISSSFFTS